MASKAKAAAKAAVRPPAKKAPAAPITVTGQSLTMEERLHRIEAMRKRIDGYIEYMCKIATTAGMSSEVKERAVAIFYEQMLIVEKQLGHIHDELRLE